MKNNLTLTFLKAGTQTTIQDSGRQAYQKMGVPIGGVLDKSSTKIANQLIGNEPDTPVLEITLTGPEILFDEDALIAITGAHFDLLLDGQKVENYRAIFVRSGSILKFGKLLDGCRSYLAIAGKWNVRKWLHSVSPLILNTDATPDSLIKKGDKVSITSYYLNRTEFIEKDHTPPIFPNKVRLQVAPGPEFEIASRTAIAKLFGQGHRITQDANRMGYRLATYLEEAKNKQEMISSGIIPGTIQITNNGQPIILLADAQTTGGYPRIVTIIEDDLSKIAQLKPGDEVWFSLAKAR